MRRQVNLADFKAKKAEEGIDITGEDGTVFTIENAALWPDRIQALAAANDNVGAATLLLGGEAEFARFVAAGGSAIVLMAIVADELGGTAGE